MPEHTQEGGEILIGHPMPVGKGTERTRPRGLSHLLLRINILAHIHISPRCVVLVRITSGSLRWKSTESVDNVSCSIAQVFTPPPLETGHVGTIYAT